MDLLWAASSRFLMGMAFRSTVAFLVFLSAAGLGAAALGLVEGAVPAVGATVVLLLPCLAVAFLAFRATGSLGSPQRPTAWDWAAASAFALVSLREFGFVLYRRRGSLWTGDSFNYGDLPLHWTYIANFARGASFWPKNPIFTGGRLQYPFGIDLLTALEVRLGLPVPGAVTLLGLACAGILLVALWRWGGGFAVAAFVFSGGVGGADAAWKNLYLALLVPQRGFLFALPAGLLLLWSFRERLLRGTRGLAPWIEGLLWGAMPLFHVHTFAFVSVVFAVWTGAGRRWREAWPTLAWAILPGTWSVLEVTDYFRVVSLVGWQPGWVMAESPLPPALFLALNFTLFLPLFVGALLLAARRRDREGLSTLAPGLGIWLGLFFVKLAPWAWDNTKVMLWCYLVLLPDAARLVLDSLPRPAAWGATALLLAPGAVDIGRSLGPEHAYEVASVAELDAVCNAVGVLPIGERVATAQTFNHPVALCGQPIVAGYEGHLWSHGIQAAAVEASLASLMRGEPGWTARARELRARYLFWGPREAAAFGGSSRPWEGTSLLVSAGRWGSLYDLESESRGRASLGDLDAPQALPRRASQPSARRTRVPPAATRTEGTSRKSP